MKLECFTVRDSKSQTFGNPFFFPTVAVCLRSVADEVQKNKDSILSSHPEDFELFHLGDFDPQLCTFTLFPAPKPVVPLKQLTNGSA